MTTLTIERQRTDIGAFIRNMRQSGATLSQIADRIGRTKERVRQILLRNYGSTKHKLISTEQLCKLSGLNRGRVMELYRDGAVTPVREWDTSIGHYFLWSPDTLVQIISHYKVNRLCKMCHSSIPKGRQYYCSKQCYEEGHKYRYKSIEAKQRHLESIKRYRERRKQLAKSFVIDNLEYIKEES